MTKTHILSPEKLHKILLADFDLGILTWRKRSLDLFADSNICTNRQIAGRWNGRHAGNIAINTADKDGYLRGKIFGKTYSAHRILYAMYHGYWPSDQVDHINGIKNDNRICNLRGATRGENAKNKRFHKINPSGIIGVSKYKNSNMWRADIKVKNKSKFLGSFISKSDAISARMAANIKYGFHENHGEVRVD